MIIDNLKINSIRNKFEQLKGTVLKYIGLVVTETILDEAFSESLFLMDVFLNHVDLTEIRMGMGL